MKTTVLAALCLSFLVNPAKGQDLPNPPANLQTLPAGSYVIPMDNTLQTDGNIGSGKFNLKAYGLIVHLLNNNVKLKWSIRAGKNKDSVDFTAMAQQFQPTLSGTITSRSFVSGPFVIFAADTTGVAALIRGFYTSYNLTGNARPKVFRTTTVTNNVDIRYNMINFKPKAAILTDGGNQSIHIDFMAAASIPTTSYFTSTGVDLMTSCYTFASEPHNDNTGPAVDSAVANIKRFVLSGRNFLGQCAAIRTYENNPLGRFMTVDGITDVNGAIGTNLDYPYPDLSYYQFQGTYNASSGGSLKNWEPTTDMSTAAFSDMTGTGTYDETQAAAVAKLITGPGGMVFYLGNHDFNPTSESAINGVRMYMNAFLTPIAPTAYCGNAPSTLPVKLVNFQGNLNNNKVTLQWTVADNEIADQFELQRSTNGTDFSVAAVVMGSEKVGTEFYQYPETMTSDKVFYRLKMTDKSGVINYSKILAFQATRLNNGQVKIINNPVNDKLTLSFESSSSQTLQLRVLDMSGRIMQEQLLMCAKGNNVISISLPDQLNRGMYLVSLSDGDARMSAKFVKQ